MCRSENGDSKSIQGILHVENIGEAVEQEETLCDVLETVGEFTYLGDRVSSGGGCEVADCTKKMRLG